MSNILFVMNVDWNWIKQRPHFLAEGLSNMHNVKIIYQYHYNRKAFQCRGYGKYDVSPMYVIPRIDRYLGLSRINVFLRRIYFRKYIKRNKSDIVYLTYPTQIESIPGKYDGKIIYDCMDNYPMFGVNNSLKDELIKSEKTICNKAYRIICSSINLQQAIIERYGREIENKIVIVRNGFDGKILEIDNKCRKGNKEITLCYFGTIAEWFDFNLLLKSLEEYKNIKYVLYGPTHVEIPRHIRIEYRGTIEHEKLYYACKDVDCLIMPFVLNEVIEAVDPVKLYEYLNFGKKIISVRYKEIERFSPFVDMFNGYDEYKKCIDKLIGNAQPLYNDSERIDFLKKNSWEYRVEQINRLLQE